MEGNGALKEKSVRITHAGSFVNNMSSSTTCFSIMKALIN